MADQGKRSWRVRFAASATAVVAVMAIGVVLGPALSFEVSRWWRMRSFGTVIAGDHVEATVPRNGRFALRWEQAVVPCTRWQVVDPLPDPALVLPLGQDRISNPRDGAESAGELFLMFSSGDRAGRTDIVLDNCLGQSPAEQASPWHERRVLHVTVR